MLFIWAVAGRSAVLKGAAGPAAKKIGPCKGMGRVKSFARILLKKWKTPWGLPYPATIFLAGSFFMALLSKSWGRAAP